MSVSSPPPASVILRVEFPDAAALLRRGLEPLHAGVLVLSTEQPLGRGMRVTLQVQAGGTDPALELAVEVVDAPGPGELSVRVPWEDHATHARLRAFIAARRGAVRVPAYRVLLVEDNEHIVQMYSRALRKVFPEERASVEVECVINGQEALQRLARDPALDLVVTDLYMPVVDGFLLAERMRTDERTRHIPVILISAAGEEAEEKARQLGIRTFLHKPVQLNMIVDSVRELMRARG